LNKVDLLEHGLSSDEVATTRARLDLSRADFVPVSAVTGWGVDSLMERLEGMLQTEHG
jgi:50S ribosomal subunit-associated GTPase HflX